MVKLRKLDEIEYSACFDFFKKCSNEHHIALMWFQKYLLHSFNKSINILSVGSGDGEFDLLILEIMRKSNIDILHYTFLEPSNAQFEKLKMNLLDAKIDINVEVLLSKMSAFKSSRKYDLIIFSHCFYYILDKVDAINKALNCLSENGFILIFHQTEFGINRIQKRFLDRFKDKSINFSSSDIKTLLDEEEIPFQYHEASADINISSIFDDSENGLKLLNFFLEGDMESLNNKEQKEIISFIKRHSYIKENKFLLENPVGIFKIGKQYKLRQAKLSSLEVLPMVLS